MNKREYSIVAGGHTFTATVSDLAEQAGGSVMLSSGNTVVFATACMSKDGKNNPGFFNLTVEYLEKYYAAGLILGSQYQRREGRPSDEAILTSRIVDRTIRPLFEKHIKNAVQVVITVLSMGDMDPGIMAINAASLALHISDIPWQGPVGAVHVSRAKNATTGFDIDAYIPNTGENPYALDLTVCGRENKICMIESLAYELTDSELGDALDLAMPEIMQLEKWQEEIRVKEGKVKRDIPKPVTPTEFETLWNESVGSKMKAGIFSSDSKLFIAQYETEWMEKIAATYPDNADMKSLAYDYYHHHVDALVHEGALHDNARVDGRAMDQVRALSGVTGGISPLLHGTGIFYRGETHVLSVLTLAGPEGATTLDGMEVRGTKRFTHHYNFPPYSAGETGRIGGINRREMGHGFLAEKALIPVIPAKIDFPYTIRLVSESMASNGSTSQASICASSLALMDGGVPISRHVSGIAMGLILDEQDETKYRILTDIQGPEDHHGDMDFKVAGTEKGITALQLDIKVGGVPVPILKEALKESRKAHATILSALTNVIDKPRADISAHTPKILVTQINPDQIGMVIGSGGKTIKGIKEATGAEITIEDDGMVYVTGKGESAPKALQIIKDMTREFKVGELCEGLVMKILEIGAVVALNQHTDGLVHISEIAPFRVNKVTDVLHEGMRVPVKVVAVDKERGRISLSIKEADKNFIKAPAAPTAPHTEQK